MRLPRELRLDRDRPHSFSTSRSPPQRLSSGNVPIAAHSADFSIAELRSLESDVDPFYFRDRDDDVDSRSSESMPSRRHRSMTSPSHKQQSYSLPTSPSNVPTVYEDAAMEDLHHSVPNIHFSFDNRKAPRISEMEAMHHSLPNMYFDAEPAGDDMEPIPFDLALPTLGGSSSSAARPMAVMSVDRNEKIGDDQQQPITISSTLIDSLAKITESAGTDDNPFEPIPLSPASKRQPSIVMSKDEFPNIDEEQSLGDAFVEED